MCCVDLSSDQDALTAAEQSNRDDLKAALAERDALKAQLDARSKVVQSKS
jgi:hypothetical protein